MTLGERLNGIVTYLLVALIAGGIAYLGNYVGRKVGRNRMTVFGLRPRHTSNLITTCTGSIIAVTTLTLFGILSEQVRGVITGIDARKRELGNLNREIARVQHDAITTRIVFQVGENILLVTANPADSPREIKSELLHAMSLANDRSIEENDNIASQQHEDPLPSDTQLVQFDDAKLNTVARQIQSKGAVTGVRVVAQRNCFYRQPVEVNLELEPVHLVFRAGEVVARKVVRRSQQLRDWYSFLGLMHQNALKEGMQEINHSLGVNVDSAPIFDEIAHLHGNAELTAVANRDLYQSTPLDVRVEVHPAPGAVAQRSEAQGVGGP